MWSCPPRGGCPPPMVRGPVVPLVRQCSSPTRVRSQNVSVERRCSSPSVLRSYSPTVTRSFTPIATRQLPAHVNRKSNVSISHSSSASLEMPLFGFGAQPLQVSADVTLEDPRTRVHGSRCTASRSPSRSISAPSTARRRLGLHLCPRSNSACSSNWAELASKDAFRETPPGCSAHVLLQGVRDLSQDVCAVPPDPFKKLLEKYVEADDVYDEVSSTATGISTCDNEADSLSNSFCGSPFDSNVIRLSAAERSEKSLAFDTGFVEQEEVSLSDLSEREEDEITSRTTVHGVRRNLRKLIACIPSGAHHVLQYGGVGAKLQQALLDAKSVGLGVDDELVAEAVRILSAWEAARIASRSQLLEVLGEFRMVDLRVVDFNSLKHLKDRLSNALAIARDVNLAESEIKEMEDCRRKAHNRLEDMKGQVRVFCRVRPQSRAEQDCDDPVVTYAIDDMTVSVDQRNVFGFDCVFEPGDQDEVFEDCQDLVQSAFDGFNVTIFTYGQTGAGKTYTMYGDAWDEGIAGRAISEIFHQADECMSWQETYVSATIVEIYNNAVADLGWYGRHVCSCKLCECVTQATGDLAGVLDIPVFSQDELKALLAASMEHRSVASHALNAESSRSHLLSFINVVGVNRATHKRTVGKIVLCDLAGSERLKKTEAVGARKKEAIEINKSLTALGGVIEAVSRKQKQVPYRNHKLTQILQDSIGGTAKTLMIVNCSPTLSNVSETCTSLKFAERAKKVTNVIDGCN